MNGFNNSHRIEPQPFLPPTNMNIQHSHASAAKIISTETITLLPPIPPSDNSNNIIMSSHEQPDSFSVLEFPNKPPNPSSSEQGDVSLHVCKQCQSELMGVFQHCLSKSGSSANLDSLHKVDEIMDAQRLNNPPYFQVIKDPTIKANEVFDDFSHKIAKERTVYYQSKANNSKGPSFGQSRFFSGNLFRRSLEAKDREIRMLREELFDRAKSESIEHRNVERMKNALDKSMKYYHFAEEWQRNESARLQQDVRFLKTELSSLMAFLINSEEEKRQVISFFLCNS
jgi:hypothetical protein